MKRMAIFLALIFTFSVLAGCLGEDDTATGERPIAEIKVDNVQISNGTYYTSVNVPVKFNGSLSIDVDGEIRSYIWTFGDGGYNYSQSASHIYLEEGYYEVYLSVKDDDGKVDQDFVKVLVAGVADYEVRIDAPTKIHKAEPGRETDFILEVTNTGNIEDTFEFRAQEMPAGFVFSPEISEMTLLPDETKLNIMTIRLPLNAPKVDTDISLRAISLSDPDAYDQVNLQIDVTSLSGGVADSGDLVQCQYIGWYPDGEVFDSSLEAFKTGRGDQPLKVSLGGTSSGDYTTVIPGFSNALVGMKTGEVNIVRLSPEEGYNDGLVRIFYVELVSIDG